MSDLDHLWPELIELSPEARLGLSRGKPAVFKWHPYEIAFWPIVGEEWVAVVEEAIRRARSLRSAKINAALEE